MLANIRESSALAITAAAVALAAVTAVAAFDFKRERNNKSGIVSAVVIKEAIVVVESFSVIRCEYDERYFFYAECRKPFKNYFMFSQRNSSK